MYTLYRQILFKRGLQYQTLYTIKHKQSLYMYKDDLNSRM